MSSRWDLKTRISLSDNFLTVVFKSLCLHSWMFFTINITMVVVVVACLFFSAVVCCCCWFHSDSLIRLCFLSELFLFLELKFLSETCEAWTVSARSLFILTLIIIINIISVSLLTFTDLLFSPWSSSWAQSRFSSVFKFMTRLFSLSPPADSPTSDSAKSKVSVCVQSFSQASASVGNRR